MKKTMKLLGKINSSWKYKIVDMMVTFLQVLNDTICVYYAGYTAVFTIFTHKA